jgi:hypothetical protein
MRAERRGNVGFESGVSDMVTQAASYAVQLFGDFAKYLALMVGVMMLGAIISFFRS